MRTYSITYDIVTEESSADGDTAERGFLINDCEIPIPPGLCGAAAAQWFKDHGVNTPVNPEDWTGSSAWLDHEDHPCERYMASLILDLPHDYIEPSDSDWSPGSWLSLYPGSDDQWTAETEEGTPGTRSLSVHFEGWTDEEMETVFHLVREGNADAPLKGGDNR